MLRAYGRFKRDTDELYNYILAIDEVCDVEVPNRYRLEARLEALCEKGCRHVWEDIEALEQGQDLTETKDLSAAERRWLLRELKQIMAVYSGRCTTD
ncbi:MAG: hypothetical protein WCA32_04220 [Chromatiaceae bacterium]|jgi:hypothetical protein